ncbi:MAG: aminoacyl-tRNA hydrolase, partial [bacterium]|nr:aminoacyl-tRNA hydrolase [bacterium]
AGHHGVESIIKALGTKEFTRLRMGIGYDKSKIKNQKSKITETEEYVLGEFRKDERPAAEEMISRTAEAIRFALEEGTEKAMGKFNG